MQVPIIKKESMTSFHKKYFELEDLKRDVSKQLSRMNTLKHRYIEWFESKHRRFLEAVMTVQVTVPFGDVPVQINTISHFRKLYQYGLKFKRGFHVDFTTLDQFLKFWDQFCLLKRDLDNIVYTRTRRFVASITRLRQPEMYEEIERLHAFLNMEFSEDHNFRETHNERENLFTYKLSMCDQRFLGLVGYMPHLADYCTKLCFYVGKLYVEKE
ncbi:unnamed protein product [Owenia fusiformis]|uniref:Uncharacterized protein n=1 Tax=Owenia fusiformis TaxID=6347 RepID=A0A8J1TFR6_OWEFU|nr:unnamed protein product [Owenia fusiformis]